jgi:hypothetical protein
MKGIIKCYYCGKELKGDLFSPYLLYDYSPICAECAAKQQRLALLKMKKYFESLNRKEKKSSK